MENPTSPVVNINPRVLVTHAAGFIGSFLCELLLKKNCQVVGIDNLKIGRLHHLDRCLVHENFSFIKSDLYQISRSDRFNYVFFLEPIADIVSRSGLSRDHRFLCELIESSLENKTKFLLLSGKTVAKNEDSNLSSSEDHLKDSLDIVIGQIKSSGLNGRIVLTQNVYGPRMDLDSQDPVASLIKNVVKEKKLVIPGKGESMVCPTFVSDLVYGLTKAMFSLNTERQIFKIVKTPDISIKTFVEKIKECWGENLRIEIVAENQSFFLPEINGYPVTTDTTVAKGKELLGWKPLISLEDGLKLTKEYFSQKSDIQKKQIIQKKIKSSKLKIKFPRFKKDHRFFAKGLLPVLIAFFLIFLPLSFLAMNSYLGLHYLKQTEKSLHQADFKSAKADSQKAKTLLGRARSLFTVYSWGLNLIGQQKLSSRLEKLFLAGDKLADGTQHLINLAENAALVGKITFQNQPGDIETYLREIGREADLAYQQFSTVQAISLSEDKLFPVEIPFELINQSLSTGRQFLTVVPEIIGLKGKRTYLVFFQNNMEIRPTGGFIGSFGLVTFDKGKMIDFEINDVYQADGQLKGHVEPPAELKKYLGEAGWYLRDSNWHPDFLVSAQRAEWFLEKEINRSVDGVIGVNLYLAQELLSRVGGLEVPDYRESITAENLFERAEYYSEVNFFPGSNQKSDFLGSINRALLEKIRSAGPEIWLAIGESVFNSLREKELLLAFHDSEVAALFSRQGWDGRLYQISCFAGESNACLLDYLMINEANVGVNKANYFVRRKIFHKTEITEDGSVQKILKIDYQNESPSENFPAGRYKNYLRILTPLNSRIQSVFLNGQKIQESEIDIQTVLDRQSFGILVEVPIQSEKTVEFRYVLNEKINFQNPVRYLFHWQKQSGIKDEQVEYSVNASPGISLFEPNPPARKSKFYDEQTGKSWENFLFTPSLTEDLVFEVGIIK